MRFYKMDSYVLRCDSCGSEFVGISGLRRSDVVEGSKHFGWTAKESSYVNDLCPSCSKASR